MKNERGRKSKAVGSEHKNQQTSTNTRRNEAKTCLKAQQVFPVDHVDADPHDRGHEQEDRHGAVELRNKKAFVKTAKKLGTHLKKSDNIGIPLHRIQATRSVYRRSERPYYFLNLLAVIPMTHESKGLGGGEGW